MIPLEPCGRVRRLPAGFDQAIYILPESGIGQHALDLVPRDRLQDDPGVMRNLPQFGIKQPPHFVGGMVPGPMHIQGEFRQGVEALDFGGQEVVDGVAGTDVFAHELRFRSDLLSDPLHQMSV